LVSVHYFRFARTSAGDQEPDELQACRWQATDGKSLLHSKPREHIDRAIEAIESKWPQS